jgi:hypothetical protein
MFFSLFTVFCKKLIYSSSIFEIKMIKKLLFILLIFWLVTSCKKEEQQKVQPQPFYEEVITSDDVQTITPEEAETYHKDTLYQYEYRTGTSGTYEYNYDVNGFDLNGNPVSGSINVEGKYGAGIITNNEDEEINIQVEWVDYGKLKGTDNEGNEYDLEVN